MKMIKKRHIQNYLARKNIMPVEELDDGRAYYKMTKELAAALESYEIEFYCFRREK